MNIITQPLIQFLYWLYSLTGNLGFSIILLTLIIRGALLPLTLPALKSQKKVRDLQPQLDAIKKKHKNDKTALSQAQMALYKENNVNPLAGCLPYLVQFGILIALYQMLRQVLGTGASDLIQNVTFLGINLTSRDTTYVLPVLAAGLQLLLSLMIIPGGDTRNIVPDNSSTPSTKDLNKKEESMQDMAMSMQRQMMFVMPIMTGVFAASFPAGLSLYWVITTAFSVVQQWFTTGPGELAKFIPGYKSEKINWPAALVKIQKENVKNIDKSIKTLAKSAKTKSAVEPSFASAFMNIADKPKKAASQTSKKVKASPKKSSAKRQKMKKSK
jgi:YidC/Oxa1 family membrane protein insertase